MKIKLNGDTRNAAIATLFIGISGYTLYLDAIRYFKYLLPFAFLGIYLLQRRMWRVCIPSPLTQVLLLYTFWSFFSLLYIDGSIVAGAKDLSFVAIYILPFFILPMKKVDIGFIFKLYTIVFIGSMLGRNFNSFSITNSTAVFENASSFAFGAFSLVFLLEKRFKMFLFALFMMFLTLKRISLVALFFTSVIWIMPHIIRRILLSKWFIFSFAMSFFALLYALGIGLLDELIIEMTGANVNAFTLGRFTLYMGVIEAIQANPYSLLWGNGVGSTYILAAKSMGDGSFVNLHSDLLKLMYENGIIFFSIFFIYGAKLKSEKSKLIFLYLSIVFISDNILIYVSVMFFILLLIEYLESQHNYKIKAENEKLH